MVNYMAMLFDQRLPATRSLNGYLKRGGNMDIKALSESIGVDPDTYLELLNMFYERTMEDMEAIEKAIHEGVSEQAAGGAHSIKGSAGNLAIDDIFELAKEMEEKARKNMLGEIPPLMLPLRDKLRALKEIL
jgi:HPt (histidine-containing phosphotransfer) domain-containing protein